MSGALPASLRPLLPVLAVVRIHSPTRFQLADRTVDVPPPETPFEMEDAAPLLPRLQGFLYRHAYCRAFRLPLVTAPPVTAPDGDLVTALSRANAGRDQWQGGWRVLPTPPFTPADHLLVGRGRERRLVPVGEVRPPTCGRGGGEAVELRLPREGRTVQRGFYFAFGSAGGPATLRRVRFYWHLSPAGAVELLARITPRLHRFEVPFQLKCPDHPDLYDRRDTAVLIVDYRHASLTAELVAEVLPGVVPHMGPDEPLFTRTLAPGLGFAEDPGGGFSFGMHRCRLVAEALWRAHTRGLEDPEAQIRLVMEEFEELGLDPHHPHLRPGPDLYRFPRLEARHGI